MPNIVPPIDREYTLRCLCGNTTIANDIEREWQTMKEMLSGFFIPVAVNPAFAARAEIWMAAGNPWDTTAMKVIDNLLIGSRKYVAGQGTARPHGEIDDLLSANGACSDS